VILPVALDNGHEMFHILNRTKETAITAAHQDHTQPIMVSDNVNVSFIHETAIALDDLQSAGEGNVCQQHINLQGWAMILVQLQK
jgi:hypothetical protein